MRQILEYFSFQKICKTCEKTLIKFDKYIEMLENFLREFREMLEKLKLLLYIYKI